MESSAQIVRTTLESFDQELSLLVNSWHTAFSDRIWILFSDKFIWIALYALVLYFLFRRLGWKKALLAVACLVLMIVCCDQSANLVKNSACRLRPCNDPWMLSHGIHLPHGAGGRYGFFSAHAANSFGFAVGSLKIFKTEKSHPYRRYGYSIMIWASLVSLSRVFLGRHYLGDILVGTIVGLAFGILWASVYKRVSLKL